MQRGTGHLKINITDSEILEAFEKIVLKAEVSSAPGSSSFSTTGNKGLRKWVKNKVTVAIFDHGDKHKEETINFLNFVSQITGVEFQVSEDNSTGEFIVAFPKTRVGYQEMINNLVLENKTGNTELVSKATCLCSIRNITNGGILTSVVLIPNYLDNEEISSCIEEEISQCMGMMNDVSDINNTIYNDNSHASKMTALDVILLRTLYDDFIKSGENVEGVLAKAGAVINKLRKTNYRNLFAN